MRFSVASALAMASTVSGHALMYGVWVNGEDQGDGQNVYIRSPANNSPVKDLTSPDIVCNVNGGKAAPKFVSAAAGDTLTFEWYHNTRSDDIIDGSHKGPIITYIAPYTETDGTGAIWTKIQEDGLTGSQWAVDKLIANKGKIDFDLPSGLKAGKYLIRQEIIAHHESDATYDQNPARGAQFYPSCVQVEVTGSGSAVPDEAFDFNTGYKYTDKGIHFNLYGGSSTYEIPGPAVWSGSSSGSGSGSGSSSGSSPSAPAATTAAPAASAPAATQPAAGGNDDSPATQAPAPVPTFSTVVRPESPSATQAEPAPANTSGPKTGCGSRRRRRSARKVAKRNVL
ncbi:hypothetical protein NW754_000384 [Fusarium falciforme]|uniref:Hypothetical protein n=1 Tax=Fusarium falciforme TaxID=195108 RepID=UPI0023019E80|nr:Hypothetical protein NCS54_00283300 [Fusarium falciforme]KAJ4137980.1 hypothetical protein NW754_000384 [Fusarium falciforme]KAJ4210450.1 hypothetical protein NW767_000723 [Fusarium falciforme]KAJ4253041.1 hypothetical protein NW757_005746 [Fusarium falciforme]WAO85587.1 Hypothetical protein NCS54_00283300 [Fusarium falciforme]